ncbi:MAG TPA: ABC transporter permease [Nitrososphaerales archaeon]|nr:ABC transporter permease [Nitrososphaerales archaeon]
MDTAKLNSNIATMRQPKNFLPALSALVLAAVFEVLNPNFFSYTNLVSLSNTFGILLLLSVGGTFVIMMASIDLSIIGTFAAVGVFTAIAWLPSTNGGWGLGYLAILIGLAMGLGLGLINGIIFAYTNIPSFIVTIATSIAYGGLALEPTGGLGKWVWDPNFRAISISTVGGVPLLIVWALIVFVVMLFLAFRTTFGRRTYAIGANLEAAKRAGILVARHRVIVFAICGFIAGLAGILFVGWGVHAGPDAGSDLFLPAIAAMVVAGNPVTGGLGGPHRTFVGALLLSILSNGLALLSVQINAQTVIFGIVVVCAIMATTDRSRVKYIR